MDKPRRIVNTRPCPHCFEQVPCVTGECPVCREIIPAGFELPKVAPPRPPTEVELLAREAAELRSYYEAAHPARPPGPLEILVRIVSIVLIALSVLFVIATLIIF